MALKLFFHDRATVFIRTLKGYLLYGKIYQKESDMHRDDRDDLSRIVNTLEDTARRIRTLEAEAQKALQADDGVAEYRQKLRQKTLLLMDLPERTAAELETLSPAERDRIRSRVNDFARRAEQAMQLESSFYMSALLYPDDYRDGEKNDLENYIDQLKRRGNGSY